MSFPPLKQECTTCGGLFLTSMIDTQERFWVENRLGLFVRYPRGLEEVGRSYNEICPTCGAENPFEPFRDDPENDPLLPPDPLDVDDVAQPLTDVDPHRGTRAQPASQPAGALCDRQSGRSRIEN